MTCKKALQNSNSCIDSEFPYPLCDWFESKYFEPCLDREYNLIVGLLTPDSLRTHPHVASLMLVVASCGKEESPAGGSGISLSFAQIEGTWQFDEVMVSTPILNSLRDELLGATVRYSNQNRATFNLANNGSEETSKKCKCKRLADEDGSIRVIGQATVTLSKMGV